MAEENKQDLRVYVIPDLRTWAIPGKFEQRSKLEYFNTFEEAKRRFDELRNEPYNSEKALGYDGITPSARLTLGIESGTNVFDIIHVRAGENYLVDDFTKIVNHALKSNCLVLIVVICMGVCVLVEDICKKRKKVRYFG